MNTHYIDNVETDIGYLEITATDKGVISIYFVDQTQSVKKNQHTEQAKQQLLEYFAGERSEFDLSLQLQGTDFQQRVWQALTNIKHGETCSYSDIAQEINNPKGVRAVGLANGKNPISIVVPCHRVIGKSGSLTGYAGGVNRKAWLLNHESDSLF